MSADKLDIFFQSISQGDIEEIYGEDMPTFERIQKLAKREIPMEIDLLVEEWLSSYDVEPLISEEPGPLLAKAFVWAGRLIGARIRYNILFTKIEEMIIRAQTHTLQLETPTPDIVRGDFES